MHHKTLDNWLHAWCTSRKKSGFAFNWNSNYFCLNNLWLNNKIIVITSRLINAKKKSQTRKMENSTRITTNQLTSLLSSETSEKTLLLQEHTQRNLSINNDRIQIGVNKQVRNQSLFYLAKECSMKHQNKFLSSWKKKITVNYSILLKITGHKHQTFPYLTGYLTKNNTFFL